MKSLHNLICNFIDFSNKTFIGLTPLSGIEKIKEELKELEESIIHLDSKENLISEYSDCLMCLFDSANRAGITLEEIIDGFDKKLELNKTRTWKLNPNNTYSHVKNEMKGLIFIEKNLEQDKLYKSIRYQLDKLTGTETYIGYFISKTKNESNTLSSKILDLISEVTMNLNYLETIIIIVQYILITIIELSF